MNTFTYWNENIYTYGEITGEKKFGEAAVMSWMRLPNPGLVGMDVVSTFPDLITLTTVFKWYFS